MRKEFGLNNKNKNPEQIDKLIFEIEGRLNDFENGLTDKEDTIKSFAFFIGECVKTAVENSQVELPVSQENGGHHTWVGSGELVRKDVSHNETTFYIDYADEQFILHIPHDFDDVTRVGEHIKATLEFYIP